MIKEFPKVFTIGQDYIKDIFLDSVEITEKIDGSQFDFGKIGNILYMRSKGKQIFPECPEMMFKPAVDYVQQLILPNDTVFYCEYLRTPKHNNLKYGRTPHNNLILFGVSYAGDVFENNHERLMDWAEKLNVDCVPLLYSGTIVSMDELLKFLDCDSILGETKIEGVVVKNYKPFMLGNRPIPVMMGKFVSEKYKEVAKDWSTSHTSLGKWGDFKQSLRTEARWEKAIQHLRDSGLLENSPKDIGGLIEEIQKDIQEEELENIKNSLWKIYGHEIIRTVVAGFPEYYKKKLAERSFG